MFSFLSALISPITNIAEKLILDKDKYAELQFKKIELTYNLKSELLKQTTTPRMDAFVKLLVTFNDVILPLLRPLGSFAMAGFAAYAATNGIELGEGIQTLLFGSPVAWGASRHVNKQAKEKTKQVESQYEDWSDEDD
jgi:hypothetical protein